MRAETVTDVQSLRECQVSLTLDEKSNVRALLQSCEHLVLVSRLRYLVSQQDLDDLESAFRLISSFNWVANDDRLLKAELPRLPLLHQAVNIPQG